MMSKMLKPAGYWPAAANFIRLICLVFLICQFLAPAGCTAQPASASLPDLDAKLRESASSWRVDSWEHSAADLMPARPPSREEINLEGNTTSATVTDLKAFNAIGERDITCEIEQNGEDSRAGQFVNSLDVSVTGRPEQAEKIWPGDPQMCDVEAVVDRALGSKQPGEMDQLSGQGEMGELGSSRERGDKKDDRDIFSNNLNIDVQGITVSAVNTVEGGSAVATSNIIIKPVQMIIVPPEVEAKLK
ncbi:MAG TPA: hypothetical protein PKK11_04135 [Methanothrix sp.]|nr:hypothetical protein [Methanothrix sp.]HPT18666.1 hypothetical protein [Methanothrix sp.]